MTFRAKQMVRHSPSPSNNQEHGQYSQSAYPLGQCSLEEDALGHGIKSRVHGDACCSKIAHGLEVPIKITALNAKEVRKCPYSRKPQPADAANNRNAKREQREAR